MIEAGFFLGWQFGTQFSTHPVQHPHHSGIPFRMALDLNLNVRSTVKPKNPLHARELLNRTRVWLNCYNVDRSIGSQHGRPPTISNDDWIASHSEDWWRTSDQNIEGFDIHTSAYTSELRVVSQFRAKIYSDPESPTGLNKVWLSAASALKSHSMSRVERRPRNIGL